jgi:hypothetical protein
MLINIVCRPSPVESGLNYSPRKVWSLPFQERGVPVAMTPKGTALWVIELSPNVWAPSNANVVW